MIDSPSGDPQRDSTPLDEPVLDVDHLGRMTLGSRDLEREVLQLFDRQTAMLAERLHGATGPVAFSCAHTLKGSARGIGAWRLARSAERVERAVAAEGAELTLAIAQLVDVIEATHIAITRRLRAH